MRVRLSPAHTGRVTSPAAPASASRPLPLSRGSLVGLTTAACLVYGLGAGTRSNFGMLVQPLVAATGLSYDRISLVMAVAQLASGVAGPLAGALALRTPTVRRSSPGHSWWPAGSPPCRTSQACSRSW